MKKCLLSTLLAVVAILLISWGHTGHRTVALIAERHLTPQAKAAVHNLLGSQSMADVSSWADDVLRQPAYKPTFYWHFLNPPKGLNHDQFITVVQALPPANGYAATLAQEKILADSSSSREQKAVALKFIIHFVGDLHQPMHLGTKEDQGGNLVQVQFEDRGTNLHSVWDSRLLDKQGLDDAQLADKLDMATPEQIRRWQSDDLMQWLWESYQLCQQQYAETAQNSKLGQAYYDAYIATVNERIEQAGIRLAGTLNRLLQNYKPNVSSMLTGEAKSPDIAPVATDGGMVRVALEKLQQHTGENVETGGMVFGYRELGSLVLVNIGAAYPNQLLTLVLRGEAKKVVTDLEGKAVTVAGKLILYKGKPEIEINDPQDITIQ